MSTIVCQGLQSCLETQTTMLRLKFSAPKSIEFGRSPSILNGDHSMEIKEKCHYENSSKSSNLDLENGGLSFLQSLSKVVKNPKKEMTEQSSYTHPNLMKPFSFPTSRLSEKSLELCTEKLGSETGTDIITESSIFELSSTDLTSENSPKRDQRKASRQNTEYSKAANSRNFPPPLTTISGPNSIQISSHRENGRLIMKAIDAPPAYCYFQAERSNGRLKLFFLKGRASNFDLETTSHDNDGTGETDDMEKFENEEDEEKYEDDEEEEEEEEECDVYMRKDLDGNSYDVEVKIGMEKFESPSRCNEGGHGNKELCNWEHLWVATS